MPLILLKPVQQHSLELQCNPNEVRILTERFGDGDGLEYTQQRHDDAPGAHDRHHIQKIIRLVTDASVKRRQIEARQALLYVARENDGRAAEMLL